MLGPVEQRNLSRSFSSKRKERYNLYQQTKQFDKTYEREYPEYKMVLYSDRNSIYASKNFNALLGSYGIAYSLSYGRNIHR